MEINVSKAVGLFFPNPSLETVYYEAIANAIDANATEIRVLIFIDSFSEAETLRIEISDNGDGFTEKNFEKFSRILETEENTHKGIGRLVFLNYFDIVEVRSQYGNQLRTFSFSNTFNGESNIAETDIDGNHTTLIFKGYTKERVHEYDYLRPISIKRSIIEHFFPLLYTYKINKQRLTIHFELSTSLENLDHGFFSAVVGYHHSDLPNLKELEIANNTVDLFSSFKLLYSIDRHHPEPMRITSICSDGRTVPINLIAKNALPGDTQAIFILLSDFFTGKTDTSRDSLNIDESTMRRLRILFQDKIAEVVRNEVPVVKESNERKQKELTNRYPHLQGYFDTKCIGLIDREKTLEDAQRRFFTAQKEILEAHSLSDEQFEKSLEVSSRLLTEYVLYRNIIINKLKDITSDDSEANIHQLIVPQRKKFPRCTIVEDIFTNNAWLLDDKYMSYSVILSDLKMTQIYSELENSNEPSHQNDGRPDITIIFSADPESNNKVDVVVVELKKLGINLAKKEEVISQLRQRARQLIQYYPNKIQRMWFYGVTEFDDEFRRSLWESKYISLYSKGDLFYNEQDIMPGLNPDVYVPVQFFILSYEALLSDAEARNETFLTLLREGLKEETQIEDTT